MFSIKSNSLSIPIIWKALLILIFLRPFLSEYAFLPAGFWYIFSLISFSLLYLILGARPFLPRTPFNLPIHLFATALLLSLIFAICPEWSLFELYWFIPNILIFYIVAKANQEQRKQIIVTMIVAAVIISVYAIYQYFFGLKHTLEYLARTAPDPYAEEFLSRQRIFATFISPNIFASYQIMMLFLGIGFLVSNLRRRKNIYWMGIFISAMIMALLLTKSLGAILTFIITLGLFLFFSIFLGRYLPAETQHKRVIFPLSVVVVITLVFLISISIFLLWHRLPQFFNFDNPQNSIVQRVYYWKTSIRIIRDFPLIGVGWRNFGILYEYYQLPQANVSHFSHNLFLQIMVETGPLGLAGLLWIVFIFLKESLGNIKKSILQEQGLQIGLFCAGCSFLIHNLIDLTFYFSQASFHWWVLLGLTVSLSRNKRVC